VGKTCGGRRAPVKNIGNLFLDEISVRFAAYFLRCLTEQFLIIQYILKYIITPETLNKLAKAKKKARFKSV
jgi:hypothetical protein